MTARTRYFLDTEFIEDGKTIVLISIALVCEDGRELYLCNRDCDLSRANKFVKDNVIPLLPARDTAAWLSHREIAERVVQFVYAAPLDPEFWAYYADYDWVALCQLFGRMIELPKRFSMHCMDIKQLAVMVGDPALPPQHKDQHDALEDARWNERAFKFLVCLGPETVEAWWPE